MRIFSNKLELANDSVSQTRLLDICNDQLIWLSGFEKCLFLVGIDKDILKGVYASL